MTTTVSRRVFLRQWRLKENFLPNGTRSRLIATVILLVIGCGAAAQIVYNWVVALPAGAALEVGDKVVTEQMLDHRVDVMGALYGIQRPPGGPQASEFRRDAAKSVAVSMILDNEAHERGIVIADKTARDELNTLVQQEDSQGYGAFMQDLKSKRTSEQDVLEELKRQRAGSQLFTEVTKSVRAPSDGEVSDAIARRAPETLAPPKRHVRNIVVANEGEANQVLSQVRSGGDFAALANQVSQDQSTKPKGGDLGTVSADQLDDGYAKSAFGTQPGSFFGPVQTRFGWNIGQILEAQPAQQLPRDQVRTAVDNESKARAWHSWLSQVIKKAHVKYADDDRPPNADAPPPMSP